MARKHQWILGAAVFFLFVKSTNLFAQSNIIDRRTKTAFGDVGYGFSTGKSKMLESNDTGSLIRVSAGTHVGEEKGILIGLDYEILTLPYALVEHDFVKTDTDILLNYRLGFFSAGLMIASSEVVLTGGGEELITSTASGFGGNTAVNIPFGKSTLTYFKAKFATYNESTDTVDETTALKTKMTIDIGGNVLLSRDIFYMVFGYRYETFGLSYLASTHAELFTTTYVGFGMGWDF